MKKKSERASVRFHFSDDRHFDMPLVECEMQLQNHYHAMARSDDPRLQEAGRSGLRKAAELLAQQSLSTVVFVKKAREVNSKYTAEDRERWRALRRSSYSQHSARRAAALIAQKEGLPPGASETIRRCFYK